MTIDLLRQLHAIIGDSIANIEQHCISKDVSFPDMNSHEFKEDAAYEATLEDEIVGPTNLIVAAADQLIAAVRRPIDMVGDAGQAYQLSSSLRIAVETGVVELLAEAGPSGLHVDDIGKQTGVDGRKIARILRVLATQHWFREVKPDVFANNRHSHYLHKGKSFNEICENPEDKFNAVNGAAPGFIAQNAAEIFRGSSRLLETLTDPVTGPSYVPEDCAFNRAHNTPDVFYKYMEQAENRSALKRMGAAIRACSLWIRPTALCNAIDWAELPEGSKVLDIGGGVGAPMVPLAKEFPHLKIIIEDRAAQLVETKKFWKKEIPGSVESGQVGFLVHDFFRPQPLPDVAVFHIRCVIPNWADKEVVTILKATRAAATPTSRLIISDYIMPYACEDDMEGVVTRLAPAPLLPNLGKASMTAYGMDMMMLVTQNGQQRVLRHFHELAKQSGWEIVEVRRTLETRWSHLIAIPI